MKQWLNGVGEWLNYVRNYKESKNNEDITDGTIVELNKKIKKLQKEAKDREYIAREKDNLLALRNQRIDVLNQEITDLKQRNDELRRNLGTTMKANNELQEKLRITENARRKNAGAIGGLKAENNKLKQDLERANQKITWLKNNQKAPTKEEILAYEMRMKEVEKRQKGK